MIRRQQTSLFKELIEDQAAWFFAHRAKPDILTFVGDMLVAPTIFASAMAAPQNTLEGIARTCP